MRILIPLVTALLAACTGEKVQGAPTAGAVLAIPAMEWHVVAQHDMEAIYENSARPLTEHEELAGFVGIANGTYVIVTPPPRYVDDAVACTLGHEMMHVALGPYHD